MGKFQQWSDTGGQKVLYQAPSVAPHQTIKQPTAMIDATKFVQSIANQIKVTQTQEAKDYANKAQAQLSMDWAQTQSSLKTAAKTGTEYLQGVSNFFTAKRQELLDNAPNSKAADQVNRMFESVQASALVQATDHAANITATQAVQSESDALNTSKVAVFLNPDAYEDQSKNIINQINKSTGIPEDVKENMIKQQLESLRTSQVAGLIKTDPYKAVNVLSTNIGLSANDHRALFSQAVSAKAAAERTTLAQQKKADAMATKLEKKIQGKTAKEGDDLLREGKLTADWLKDNAQNLDKADHRYFSSKLGGAFGPEHSDINVYVNLDGLARSGQPVANKARAALLNGDLTESDYDKIMTRAQSQTNLPSAYKEGESYLSNVFQVNPLNPAAGAPQRRAQALYEYDQWYRNNPNSDASQSMAKAQEIENRYRTANLTKKSETILYGPAPIYLSGTRTDPNIPATAAATSAAYKAGKIGKEEYQREVSLIMEWKKINDEAVAARENAQKTVRQQRNAR